MDRPAHFLPVLHHDVVQHRQAEQKPQRHLEGTRPVTAAVPFSRSTVTAVTPATAFRAFSTRAWQWAHIMPSIWMVLFTVFSSFP